MMNTQVRQSRAAALVARMDQAELKLCRQFNALVHRAGARRIFQVAERLGDGIAWYLLIAVLLACGRHGALVSLQMAVSGLSGLLLYRYLKRTFVRERPFITHTAITRAGAPLDRFSFPSGHTLHAVCFTILAVNGFPVLGIVLVPLAVTIALSRVVLGLHYPSDVLVGALIGTGMAAAMLALLPAGAAALR
jgi:undecaprenyl-diphosphatase